MLLAFHCSVCQERKEEHLGAQPSRLYKRMPLNSASEAAHPQTTHIKFFIWDLKPPETGELQRAPCSGNLLGLHMSSLDCEGCADLATYCKRRGINGRGTPKIQLYHSHHTPSAKWVENRRQVECESQYGPQTKRYCRQNFLCHSRGLWFDSIASFIFLLDKYRHFELSTQCSSLKSIGSCLWYV